MVAAIIMATLKRFWPPQCSTMAVALLSTKGLGFKDPLGGVRVWGLRDSSLWEPRPGKLRFPVVPPVRLLIVCCW